MKKKNRASWLLLLLLGACVALSAAGCTFRQAGWTGGVKIAPPSSGEDSSKTQSVSSKPADSSAPLSSAVSDAEHSSSWAGSRLTPDQASSDSSSAASSKAISSETASGSGSETGASSEAGSSVVVLSATQPQTSQGKRTETQKPGSDKPVPNPTNTVYLTFDDGPTTLTPQVLDVLKEKGVKATFFVVCKKDPSLEAIMKRAYEEGHEIAIHSATHDYKKIYASTDAFSADFEATQKWIQKVTGNPEPILQFRFPGGSSISKKLAAPETLNRILLQMKERGAIHNDWNVSAEDAAKTVPTREQLLERIIPEALKYNEAVILMHDSVRNTHLCEALPEIIDSMLEQGYAFDVISKIHHPVQHRTYGEDGVLHRGGGYLKRVK